jgi:hypothetical protein
MADPQITLSHTLLMGGSLDNLVAEGTVIKTIRDRLAALGIKGLEEPDNYEAMTDFTWRFAPAQFGEVATVLEAVIPAGERNAWILTGLRDTFDALEPRVRAFRYQAPGLQHFAPARS